MSDRFEEKTWGKGNRFTQTFLFVRSHKPGRKTALRQHDKFNRYTCPDFLKTIYSKFPRCYLFMDKASPHHKSRKVKDSLGQNKGALIPVYFPTASHEFMMIEEVSNIAERELLVLKYYPSFKDFKKSISLYFRTKRFGLIMRNYLLRTV